MNLRARYARKMCPTLSTEGAKLHDDYVTLLASSRERVPNASLFYYIVFLLHILCSALYFFEIIIATWTQELGEFDQSVRFICDQVCET